MTMVRGGRYKGESGGHTRCHFVTPATMSLMLSIAKKQGCSTIWSAVYFHITVIRFQDDIIRSMDHTVSDQMLLRGVIVSPLS